MSLSVHNALASPQLCCNYLEKIAIKRALYDTENEALIQGVAFSCIEQLVHFLFCYVLYVFYPSYEQFYYEKQVEAFTKANKPLPRYDLSFFSETVLFFHRCLANPSGIGSIFPSSTSLIETITNKIPSKTEPGPARIYLEIGAGTGCFTEEIIKKMRPDDHLDVVEYDPDLCKLLRRKFIHLKNVAIHEISITDFKPGRQYDAMVSGLPLTVFKTETVAMVLKQYEDLAKPGATFSYFEYIALPKIKGAFLCGAAYDEFTKLLKMKETFATRFHAVAENAILNLPPARIMHCQMTK